MSLADALEFLQFRESPPIEFDVPFTYAPRRLRSIFVPFSAEINLRTCDSCLIEQMTSWYDVQYCDLTFVPTLEFPPFYFCERCVSTRIAEINITNLLLL